MSHSWAVEKFWELQRVVIHGSAHPICRGGGAKQGQNSAMRPEVSELLKRAIALPLDEPTVLANTLLDSLEEADRSVQAAWDEEVARRM